MSSLIIDRYFSSYKVRYYATTAGGGGGQSPPPPPLLVNLSGKHSLLQARNFQGFNQRSKPPAAAPRSASHGSPKKHVPLDSQHAIIFLAN